MKILIAGYYGFGNLGDELILSTMIHQLKAKYKEAQLSVLSASPQHTTENHHVQAVHRWNPISVFRSLWQADLFLLGGGGLLQDQTSFRSLAYYLGLIMMARLCQTSVVLYALGVESLQHRLGKWLVKKVLSFSKVTITVRDYYSKTKLKLLGVPDKDIHVTGDPVFSRSLTKRPVPRYQVEKKSVLMIPRFPCPEQGWATYRQIAKFFRETKGYDVKCILFHTAVEESYLFSNFHEPIFTPHEYIFKGSIDEIVSHIEPHNYIISARFHGLVLAAMANRPFLGIGEIDKVKNFCDKWSMPFVPWDATQEDIVKSSDQLTSSLPNPLNHDLDQWRRASTRTLDFV